MPVGCDEAPPPPRSDLPLLLDEALFGSAHFDHALSRGTGFNHKVGKVSSSMGEDMGLWYVKSVVGPTVLYATQ